MDNVAYLLSLHSIDGLGPVRLKLLIDYYQDPKLAWEANPKELKEIGLPQGVVNLLIETRKKLIPERYLEDIIKSKISWTTLFDDDYPALLKEIYDPPVVLFCQGDLSSISQPSIAIVGTRKVTGYGKLVTEKFAEGLAGVGITIVSGLARGVDTIAHQSAVRVKGKTIAVLGGGLKSIFPPENLGLAKKIVEEGFGAIVSEFSPDEPSLPGNFPARNRIISGLSKAVLVTEAAEGSGSLITAKCALDQGRTVFAVPGPITSDFSQGPLSLIKQGAIMVSKPEEIVEELGLVINQKSKIKDQNQIKLTEIEDKILEYLKNGERQVDEVCRELKLSSAAVSSSLVRMELFGYVKNLGGGIYCRI